MKRIITAISLSVLFGAAGIGALHAGGPPDDGYQTPMEQAPMDLSSQSRMDDGGGPDTASAESGDARGAETGTFYGLPVVYRYPLADGSAVRPGHIGAIDTENAGTPVAEITGQSVSVAALTPDTSEDFYE